LRHLRPGDRVDPGDDVAGDARPALAGDGGGAHRAGGERVHPPAPGGAGGTRQRDHHARVAVAPLAASEEHEHHRRLATHDRGSIGVFVPRASSIAWATSSVRWSRNRSALTSTPTGRPSTWPAGTHADGSPRTLAGVTQRIISIVSSDACTEPMSKPCSNGS